MTPQASAQVCSSPLGGIITCPAGAPVAGVTVNGAVTPVTVVLNNGVQSVAPVTVGTVAGVNATINSVGTSVITTANQPALVVNSGSGATAQVNTLTTTGDGATGALLRAVDGLIFTSNDVVSTAGANADGVNAQGRSVTANVNTVTTGGDDSNALNLVSLNGPITANATALRTNGLRSNGEILNGAGIINTNVGLIQTNGDQALGASITNNAAACVLLGRGGCGVNANFGQITTNGFGGIGALVNATGPTNITVNALRTNGGQAAGLSLNVNPAACIVLGVGGCGTAFTANNLTTQGANSPGALVRAAGPVSGNIGVLQTNGANAAGLDFASNPNACVVLGRGACDSSFTLGQLTTSGAGATGALIRAAGLTTLNVNTANTAGAGATAINVVGDPTACVLLGAGACNTNVTANRVTTMGDGSAGVLLNAPARLIANLGVVQTSGNNSNAVQLITDPALCVVLGPGSCGGSVTVGTVGTTGGNSGGVVVTSPGPITINDGGVTTTGPNSPGVVANGGTGDITIVSGPVTTTGPGSDGIDAMASGCANVSVTATGAISSAQGYGINASSACRVTVVTQPGAPVSGGLGGIQVASGTGATVTIGDRLSSTGGAALGITGAPAVVTIQATGDVVGRITLTSSNNQVINNGRIDALGDSSFGGSGNVLVSSGVIAVRPTQTTPGSVTFAGLTTTTNSGLIDLRNGVAGDTLNLTGAFTGVGASTLALDVAAGTPSVADRLLVAGAATGSTGVIVNPINTGFLTNGLVVARGGAGTSPTAFILAGGTQNRGLVTYTLGFNAATNEFALSSAPGPAAYELTKLGEVARESFYRTDDAISSRLEQTGDAAHAEGETAKYSALWGVVYGGENRLRSNRTFTALGQTSTVNLGYSQDSYGAQFGYDRLFGATRLGVTGGFSNAFVRFNSADRLTYRGANIGGYGQYVNGRLFMNVIGRYERYSLAVSQLTSGLRVKPHGDTWGGKAEAGLYYGGQIFFEPHASLDYVRTSLDRISALNSTLDFPDADGLRGRAGFRVGSTITRPSTVTRIYAGVDAVHEFQGDDRVNFSNNGFAVALKNSAIATYGQAKAGASMEFGPRVRAYVEGFGDFGSGYTGGGGRAGISVRF